MMTTKYKMFLNFMYNELGITKEDIREWIGKAVQVEAYKRVADVDITEILSKAIHSQINDLSKNAYYKQINEQVKREIAAQIVAKLDINMKE